MVSTCEVTETATGGATTSTVTPQGPFEVTADSAETPVVVTVTNRFDVGSLRLIKTIDGNVADDTPVYLRRVVPAAGQRPGGADGPGDGGDDLADIGGPSTLVVSVEREHGLRRCARSALPSA